MKNLINLKNIGGVALGMATVVGAVSLITPADAQSNPNYGKLIVNEYNAVGPTKTLEDGESDTFFGQITGNGGDWLELVVTEDIADMGGWTITWDNDDPDTGTVTFVDDGTWTNLKAGTIITLRAGGTTDTSFSTSCSNPDWWIRIDADDDDYVTQTGHSFKTDNDGWRVMIEDDNDDLVQDWVGEPNDAVIWAGSGVNSREVGKLEADPVGGTSDTQYNDGNCSSFGSENCWDDGDEWQDFSGLRTCTP